jgi:hypothetical protein
MQCPPELAKIVLEIVKRGILFARLAGWEGDANRAAIEADHVHNLPDLLESYTPEKLSYYREVEIPSYLQQGQAAGIETGWFEGLWEKLRVFVERQTGSAGTR